MRVMDRGTFYKWLNVVVFGLLYSTVYLARFGFNEVLPQRAAEYGISGAIQLLLSSCVFIGYAAGCFVNGFLIDRYRATRFIIMGSIGSVVANLLLYSASSWVALMALSLFNGYIQSMVWIGGISIIVRWFRKPDRGLPVGIANMCSAFAYPIMLYLPDRLLPTGGTWSDANGYAMFIICYALVVFIALIHENPSDFRLGGHEDLDAGSAANEGMLARLPQRYPAIVSALMKDRSMAFWMGIAFLSSFCRYGLLTLLPVYYSEGAEIALSSDSTNFMLSAGMGAGTLVCCILVGRRYCENPGIGVVACAGLSSALVVLFPSISSGEMIMAGIFMVGFLLFGINGILWLQAMNAGERLYAGTATGLLNGAAYLGALLQSLLLPFAIGVADDWDIVFLSMEIVCILMIVCALFICKRDTNIREA